LCDLEDKILLNDSTKKRIRESESIELFEVFFSTEMKQYIIDANKENDLHLQMHDLNIFIAILMVSSFNKRKSQRNY